MSRNIDGHLLLTGMMGSGKSTVGPKLAQALHYSFYDLDDEIVAAKGVSIAEIFERYGEVTFRQWELESLSQLLSQPVPVVLALGGGSLGNERVFSLIQHHQVIWLEAPTEALWHRVCDSPRPLVKRGLEAFRRMHQQRRKAYAKAAMFQVDCNQDPDIIVRTIVEKLGAHGNEQRNSD